MPENRFMGENRVSRGKLTFGFFGKIEFPSERTKKSHVEKFFFAPAEDGGGLASRPQTAFNRHVSRRRASIQQHQEQLEASQQLPSAPWMMKSSKSMHALPVVKPRFHEADFTQPRQLLVDTTNRSTYR